MSKTVIWQVFTRLFCNSTEPAGLVPGGTLSENGCGKMNSYTSEVLDYFRSQGATHIWFTGLLAHASRTDYPAYGIPASHPSTVKGRAGSPYAIRDYYDIDPDLAVSIPKRFTEFNALVRRVHGAGLGFIMDFVPNHVAREYHSIKAPKKVIGLGEDDNNSVFFSQMNNFYYIPNQELGGQHDWQDYREYPAKATGNDQFSATPSEYDWYETVKLNYGVDYSDRSGHFDPRPDTWNKMTDILLYWADKGVDGFRCDMAEMVPVEFWQYAIAKVKDKYPDILFIAEIYNPGAYRTYLEWGGFDYLYDKVGLYDTLRAITTYRESATAITRCWQQTGSCGSRMLHFLENHDEQRIASDFFAGSGIRGRAGMIVSACMDTCPVMVYAGQELGERGMDEEGFSGRDGRSTIFDYWNPDTLYRLYNNGKLDGSKLTDEEKSLQKFYSNLLNVCKNEKSIAEGKFFDLMYVNPVSDNFNAHRQYAFMRSCDDEALLIVVNFDDKPVLNYINIPEHAFDYMGIPKMDTCRFTDLLNGNSTDGVLHPDCPVRVNVPANGGAILKIRKSTWQSA